MHFIIGGSFNGKAAWVKRQYEGETIAWHNAYIGERLPEASRAAPNCVILEGIEQWIREDIKRMDKDPARSLWKVRLDDWLRWEAGVQERKLVLIGTDITKGIVPMEKQDRDWRDAAGWIFQYAAAAAERVDLIWYGIGRKLK
ncbi:bifunctional adenosylcobinamide kinase/adenosylcobinamide-phosphate guanylyltransferase [Bacillus infantis]|uniref:bifunctional adenosylcobinamide kinase/adenosylcobinamide-phosphate guanylyltransferase n=1 Tax=Bacillus infantis TaxID=324767 RepID=UPI001CD7E72B|nr:bifunctional adenosylcobinamide kinase/adenosylcobinamide-phosphate guanylyltransferase [Bacillus infantis]MCA1037401.1 bifunctional adenosylcobinamide kinase/adenosylcobinamide-phosphate guanylyltransferase [Bacillus infantis]